MAGPARGRKHKLDGNAVRRLASSMGAIPLPVGTNGASPAHDWPYLSGLATHSDSWRVRGHAALNRLSWQRHSRSCKSLYVLYCYERLVGSNSPSNTSAAEICVAGATIAGVVAGLNAEERAKSGIEAQCSRCDRGQ